MGKTATTETRADRYASVTEPIIDDLKMRPRPRSEPWRLGMPLTG